MKVKIAWNGTGGELVSHVIEVSHSNDIAIHMELIRMVEVYGSSFFVGDSITITEEEE